MIMPANSRALRATDQPSEMDERRQMMHHLRRSTEEVRPARTVSRLIGLSLAGWFLCIVFSAATIGDARAAGTKIRTLSLAPLPKAATVEIRLPVEEGSDDLGLAVTLADHFSVLLMKRGYTTVAVDGELIFRFAAEEPTYAQGEGRPRHAGPAIDTDQADEDRAGFRSGAFASPAALSVSDQDSYRLRVSVARARKPPLWTGYIERSAKGAERRAIYVSMADALLKFWGQTHSKSD